LVAADEVALNHWVELDRTVTPDGDELVLRQRGDAFEIRFNGWELMSSRTSASEEALARLVCEELGRKPARVLVGGLGMGYTLRAILDAADANARIVVAELAPLVVEWVRGPLASLAHHALDDPRVQIRIGSVVGVLSESSQSFDAILLDTDNGPEAIVHEPNALLYAREGLELAKTALQPGGAIAFWAADPSPAFENRLTLAGATWRRLEIDARGGNSGPEHSIYLARFA
jgi:spermidine synthase